MLTSATSAVARCGLTDRICLAHGDATAFDARVLFGVAAFDRIFIFIQPLDDLPTRPRVLDAAISQLAASGSLHVVDFGNQEQLPQFFRTLLLRWLALFDVSPRGDSSGRWDSLPAAPAPTFAMRSRCAVMCSLRS